MPARPHARTQATSASSLVLPPPPPPHLAPAAAPPAAPPSAAAPAGGAAPSAAPPPAGPAPPGSRSHKNTTLIPGWSRALSSQQLHIECQKIAQPLPALTVAASRGMPPPQRGGAVGVLEMEVMKFVAYCGGVCVKFRIDELGVPAPGPPGSTGGPPLITWGLASTRACPALLHSMAHHKLQPKAMGPTAVPTPAPAPAPAPDTAAPPPSEPGAASASTPTTAATPAATGSAAAPPRPAYPPPPLSLPTATSDASLASPSPPAPSPPPGPGTAAPAGPAPPSPPALPLLPSNPTTPVAVDSPSHKPLYLICAAGAPRPLAPHDVLAIELAPREDKQPVIVATLRLNGELLAQQSLPCASISSLQVRACACAWMCVWYAAEE